ncbi:beta strand repeat-containing protein [Neptunomonas antarctica]|nr:hemagglutinin repeat-containing protein [Neptunomonas antarctica]
MNLTIGNGLTNSGTLLAKTSLSSNSGSLTNSGTLQANQGSTIGTGALSNTGKIIASDSSSAGATLNVATLSNTGAGVIQSAQNLAINVSGGTLTNAKTIIAARDLTLTSTGAGMTLTNQSGGFIQSGTTSGDTLTIGGTAVILNNNTGGKLLGNQLVIATSSVTNAGTIQGGTAASTITASGTVTNSGTLNLSSTGAGSGTINANTINNSGTLQSLGAAALNVATTLSNTSQLLSSGNMTVRGTDGYYIVSNSGRMQSSGLMDVKGQGNGRGVDITLNGSGAMVGQSMDINAGTLSVNNTGSVSSTGAMTLGLNSLNVTSGASKILGNTAQGAATTIAITNGFTNYGVVHSGGNLNLSAAGITNAAGAGISSLATLDIRATGGNLSNSASFYAGSRLVANATGTFTNTTAGTIDSDGTMSFTAPRFVNNGAITAVSDISLNTTTSFKNEYSGGLPSVSLDWANATYSSVTKIHEHEESSCTDCNWIKTYEDTITVSEKLNSPLPPTKPQILSGRNMTINYGAGTASNTVGLLSAVNNITVTGTGSFTNESFDLDTYQYKRHWFDFLGDCFTCSSSVHSYRYAYNDATFAADPHFSGTDSDLTYGSAGAWAKPSTHTAAGAQSQAYKKNFGVSSTALNSSAGLFAGGTILINGGALATRGSTTAQDPGFSTPGSTGNSSVGGPANGTTSSSSGVTEATTASGAAAISFGGLVIALPTNPNGYFVISQNSGSGFLIETNPLFAVGSNFVGSDYMAQRYGYNPDLVIKRLGDSNYEAYLIRQQLISQTGNNIINGYGNEADQMKRLMDQAVTEGKSAGFIFGKALTTDQIANLEGDVVWMVETTVAGQKVLAPVVYLSTATRNAIVTGAVIAGSNVIMDVDSVTNTGGTISGSNSLAITSKGDVTNTSGTITGGNVAVTSTEGSITNQTSAEGFGDDSVYVTRIGKQGGITATGDLALDAEKDIVVLGAQVKAGGDASLVAGDNVTFDTIVDKTTTSTASSTDSGFRKSITNNTTTTETNIGSTLESGGNLKITSGGDTTIAGSDASVGGDLSVDAGGDFNILARQDKVTSKTVTETSGLGVGGGVAGTEKTTTDDFKGTNSGSTLTVGGSATVKADKSMTVQGSDVTIAGDADINAKEGINILDGLDETRTNTVTETTTYLKIDSEGESDSSSDSSSGSESGLGRANATASAEANAEASGTSDIKFAETTTTSTQAGSNTSVSSNFKVGGNLKATTEGTLKVQGSNVESGGDMELDAKNVEVLTGRNEEWTNTQTVRTSVGIYNEGEANAEAGADAQAKAGTAGTDASASANASAEASGTTTIGARTENEETTDYSLTNSSSTLKSGGSMSIKAKEAAVFVGAEVESGGDMNIEATDILNMAAQDITLKTSSKKTDTAGLYIDAKVSAEAGAEADAGKINVGGDPANGEAGGEVGADVSAGVRYKTEQESSAEGSVTQVTSGFKSGGNFTRKATNEIVDQGTQIEAGGDINQSARAITEIEANDSTFSSKDSSSHDMKLGVGASASAEAGGNAKGEAESDAGAGAGLRAKYEGSIDSESESTTTAVTTKYKSGGSINSKSEEKTTLIGTQFESGGDINIEAGSLEYKAAKDTTSMSSDANKIDAELKVDVVGKAGASLEASYGNEGESGSTSTARTGGINAGGNLTIKTTGDASFEGTQIEAGGAADIDAGGSVDFKAARDTSESSKSTIDASVELSSSKGSKGAAASGGYTQEDSASSTAQTGSIKAGSGGISITAGKDASFEGTALKSEGDTSIDAAGNVNLKAAKNTETTTSFGVEASIGAEKGDEGTTKEGSIGGSAAYANKVDSDATSIESGGKVSIKGNNVVNQEANIKAKEGTQIIGNEVKIKAEKSDISVGIEASVSGESEPEKKTGE